MKLNLNTILFVLGAIGLFAPDVQALAALLASVHISFLVTPIKVLGFVATAMGGLAIAVPRLRAKLASLGLATPPGAQAPWNPAKDNVVPMVQAPRGQDPDSANTPAKPARMFPVNDPDAITRPFSPKIPPQDPTG
jgi:hypothetical protein